MSPPLFEIRTCSLIFQIRIFICLDVYAKLYTSPFSPSLSIQFSLTTPVHKERARTLILSSRVDEIDILTPLVSSAFSKPLCHVHTHTHTHVYIYTYTRFTCAKDRKIRVSITGADEHVRSI